jgi:coronin-7
MFLRLYFVAQVKLWDVSSCFQEEGAHRAAALSSLEPTVSMTTHTNSVRTVTFHPTVSGLVSSTAQDQTLRYFDAEQGSEVCKIQLPQVAVNVSYNFDGSLIALAGKDRSIRIVDPRANSVVASTADGSASSVPGSRLSMGTSGNPHLGRNLRVAWCCTRTGAHADPLISVSSGSNGLRQMHLWDPRSLQQPLITKSIDSASGQLFPLFDETMNTIFLAGKGDTVIRTYEMLFLEETTPTPGTLPSMLEKSTDFQSSIEPIAGICMIPKRTCDVRNVEVARLLKLTTDALVPISFKVPRADHLKAYFHDDLYPPVRAARSLATVPDWESAETDPSVFEPILESLQPEDMVAISTAPVEPTPSATRSKVDSFKQAIQKQEEESKQREDRFAKLQQMAVQNAQYNRNLSGGTASAALQAAQATQVNVQPGATASAFAGLSADRLKAGQLAVAAAEEEVDSDDNWDDED